MKIGFACVLSLSLGIVSSACGGDAPANTGSFPAATYASVSTDTGAHRVDVRTSPSQPPVRGEVSVELVITDANGAPVDGLALDVVPWMPAMGHGTSVTPNVVAEGGGAYRVQSVDMFMPGTWQLRVSFAGEHLMTTFDVQ
jgi:hypothetical protein